MPGIISVSRAYLTGRRKKLRQKQQMKIFQTIWRSLAAIGLAGGLLWIAVQPIWVLKNPKDIVISGNQLLSQEAIQSLLALSYPQSLWRIEPSKIANSLRQQPTIAQASVSRRIFPPGLIIHVQERVPVALTQMHREQTSNDNGNKNKTIGLLDANGVWVSLEKFTSLNPRAKLPTLKVIGVPEQYRPYWAGLYQAISQSSVKVTEIDWRNPTNLIMQTELGQVHLGSPNSQLSEQMKVLAQMRDLPSQLNFSQIEYIDLKNPQFPIVQMHQKNQQMDSKTP